MFKVRVSNGFRVRFRVGFRVRVRVGFRDRVSLMCNTEKNNIQLILGGSMLQNSTPFFPIFIRCLETSLKNVLLD